MAALTITVAQVLPDTTGKFLDGIAGATITAGQPCYKDSTDSNKMKPADANASVSTAAVVGIATHGSLAGQPIRLQQTGDITLGAGAAPVVATQYILGATAGDIAPVADKTTGWYLTTLGVGIASNKLRLDINATGQLTG